MVTELIFDFASLKPTYKRIKTSVEVIGRYLAATLNSVIVPLPSSAFHFIVLVLLCFFLSLGQPPPDPLR
ncbi:hypothetical protein Q3G72_007105 [Acer saccharum]|nr:hypothetical protein Q3G72_007105 [Acer saccharum]